MGMIVTNGSGFFSEEKRHADHEIVCPEPGIPVFRLNNRCLNGRYHIEKKIFSDPDNASLVQWTGFKPLASDKGEYRLHLILAPHLGNKGANNSGWVDNYKGNPMLFAEGNGVSMAVACSAPWLGRSAGFVGFSDGWQDLNMHKRMTWFYNRADNGNIALTAQIDWMAAKEKGFIIVLSFGLTPAEAGFRAINTLQYELSDMEQRYIKAWKSWQKSLLALDDNSPGSNSKYRTSTMTLRIHEAKRFPGGIIAGLSIPWGFSRGDDDLGGYHVVWPRDQVEVAGALLAANAFDSAKRVLEYLKLTQEKDGHWPQNMWLDGIPMWKGIQMDETAFPILLVDMFFRSQKSNNPDISGYWPMVRSAASFLVRNGPVTQQDRWEEDPGYTPFTLAVEIAALLAAADCAQRVGEDRIATYLRELADSWNDNIDRWIYVKNTDLCNELEVDGYYVRIGNPDTGETLTPSMGYVPIKNRPPGDDMEQSTHLVSPDAVALVRFGIRAPDDPKIVNTVKVIDSLLKTDTPFGPAWHRYNDDGYGEHKDGSPFDGTGIGRAWPLLTGERAHYELAAGRYDEARRLLDTLEAFANKGGMIPEQIWDDDDIPGKELFFGRPSGSAMPLAWAHAEHIKLLRSLHDGRVFDMPPQTVQRYQVQKRHSQYAIWRFNHKCRSFPDGKILRIEVLSPALVHWSSDNWRSFRDTRTEDTGLGVYTADLKTNHMREGSIIDFTFFWIDEDRWEGRDYSISVRKE